MFETTNQLWMPSLFHIHWVKFFFSRFLLMTFFNILHLLAQATFVVFGWNVFTRHGRMWPSTQKKKRCMKRIQRCRHKPYRGARSMQKLTAAIGPANVRFQVQKPPSNLPKLEHDTWNCGHKPKQGEVWSFRFATANVYLNLVACCSPAHIDNV